MVNFCFRMCVFFRYVIQSKIDLCKSHHVISHESATQIHKHTYTHKYFIKRILPKFKRISSRTVFYSNKCNRKYFLLTRTKNKMKQRYSKNVEEKSGLKITITKKNIERKRAKKKKTYDYRIFVK